MRNPLDPEAFSGDPSRHKLGGKQQLPEDAYRGVHFTDDFETALVYAVNKASQTSDSIGVVFEVDTSGLELLPDADAMLESGQSVDFVQDLRGISEVVEAWEARDGDELQHEASIYFEALDPEAAFPTTWFEAVYAYVDNENDYAVGVAIDSMSPDEALALFDFAFHNGYFPAEFFAQVIGQWRTLSPIHRDRLLRVHAVRPVRPDLWGHDPDDDRMDEYPPQDESEPQIFSDFEFHEGGGFPDTIVVWDSERGGEGMFHGTDITRAKQAFPGLSLRNPWPYTQE